MTRLRVVPVAASTQERPGTQSPPVIPSVPAKLKFAVETLYQIGQELPPLLVQHSKEIDDGSFPLDIDWNAYFAMTAAGQLRFLTARIAREDGRERPDAGVLVGYIANIVRTHLRFKTTLHCFIEAYWLAPAYREGWEAVRMFRENDRLLKEWGVRRVFVAVEDRYKDGKAEVLFRRLGYTHAAESMTKVF
jgi:hypothetical protein